ncbi:hypothetical protein V5799_019194 [Amblyomma americanum]|uniref:Secreted protein n=1 Tax=Amblyomma americanum TaxID=6943 RepID=A0AAQ4EXX9_AMBAM
MKATLLCLCVLSAVIIGSQCQPFYWPYTRPPYCPRWCPLKVKRVGTSCGDSCACVFPAPGQPERPLACIWSPAWAVEKRRGGPTTQTRI